MQDASSLWELSGPRMQVKNGIVFSWYKQTKTFQGYTGFLSLFKETMYQKC